MHVGENGHSYCKIYRYKIDENNNSLIYEKTVFEQITYTVDASSELIYEDSYMENGDSISLWRETIEYVKHRDFKFIDFYLDGEEVKPFYGINTSINEYFKQLVCYSYEICSDDRAYVSRYYGFSDEGYELYYGNNKIESGNNICSGGGLQNGGYHECTNKYKVGVSSYPVAIFNKNDLAYMANGQLVSTLPFDLSKYIINASYLYSDLANGNVRLNSHLLKGNSYSFNLIQNWTGISFSSSLGTLDCGGMLVTDHQLDGGYVTRKDFGFSVLKSCDDFKEINAPSFSINEKEVYDFYVK